MVEGKSGCENTSWEVSAGNQMQEYGNLVWGGEVKIPSNKFHILALLTEKGQMGVSKRLQTLNEMLERGTYFKPLFKMKKPSSD